MTDFNIGDYKDQITLSRQTWFDMQFKTNSMNKTLYIHDLIEGVEYYECLHSRSILINKVDVANEKVYYQFENKSENGGGTIRQYMNQIECNRYIQQYPNRDYSANE